MKKMTMLMMLVLCLCVAGSAHAIDYTFDNGEGNSLWTATDSLNWDPNGIPQRLTDNAFINGYDVTIPSGQSGASFWLKIGSEGSNNSTLTVDGSLTTKFVTAVGLGGYTGTAKITIDGGTFTPQQNTGIGNGSTGVLEVINGGQINQTDSRYGITVGSYKGGGNGYMLVDSGGVVNAYRFTIGYYTQCVGHVQLNDGTIYATTFNFGNTDPAAATLGITTGKLVLDGDLTADATLLGYINDGFIIAYGGLGTVEVTLNGDGNTEITGVSPPVSVDHLDPHTDGSGTNGLWHMDILGSSRYVYDDNSSGRDQGATLMGSGSAPGQPGRVDPIAAGIGYPADNPLFGNCLYNDKAAGNTGLWSNIVPVIDGTDVRIEAWFKAADAATFTDARILYRKYDFDARAYSNRLEVLVRDDALANHTITVNYADYGATFGDWMHVAAVILDGQFWVEFNGIAISPVAIATGVHINTKGFEIGKSGTTWIFDGYIDEVRISKASGVAPPTATDCGDWGYLDGDFDGNCIVDSNDLSIMALDWLETTNPASADAVYGSYDDYNAYNIPQAVTVPTIDGVLSVGEWDDAKMIEIVYPDNVTAPNVGSQKYDEPTAADFSAYYYYKWDATNLYVGIQVYDEVLNFTGGGYPGDHVTLAVNPLQAGTASADVAFYNMYMTDPNVLDAVISTIFNQALAADNAEIATATQEDGLITIGWSYEVALKWSDMDGYSPTVGDTHGFAVLICDADAATRETFLMDAGAGNTNVITTPSDYRVVTLTDALVCGDFGYVDGDADGNCKVDMADFARMASGWMNCTDPAVDGCVDAR